MNVNGGRIRDLIRYDRGHARRPGTNPVEKLFLYSTVRYLRPDRVIEVGVSGGNSTVWIAAALRDAGRGHLFAVDRFEGTDGGAAKSPVLARERLRACGLSEWATVIPKDSVAFLQGCSDDYAEIVWVDGGHSYEQARADVDQAFRVASRLVVVHDTNQVAYDAVRRVCVERGGGAFIDGTRGIWICHV